MSANQNMVDVILPGRFQPITNAHIECVRWLLTMSKYKDRVRRLYLGVISPMVCLNHEFHEDPDRWSFQVFETEAQNPCGNFHPSLPPDSRRLFSKLVYTRVAPDRLQGDVNREHDRFSPYFNLLHRCEVATLIYLAMDEALGKMNLRESVPVRVIPILPPLSRQFKSSVRCQAWNVFNTGVWLVPPFDDRTRKLGIELSKVSGISKVVAGEEPELNNIASKYGCEINSRFVGAYGTSALALYARSLNVRADEFRRIVFPPLVADYLEHRQKQNGTEPNALREPQIDEVTDKDWLLETVCEQFGLNFPPPETLPAGAVLHRETKISAAPCNWEKIKGAWSAKVEDHLGRENVPWPDKQVFRQFAGKLYDTFQTIAELQMSTQYPERAMLRFKDLPPDEESWMNSYFELFAWNGMIEVQEDGKICKITVNDTESNCVISIEEFVSNPTLIAQEHATIKRLLELANLKPALHGFEIH